MVKASVTILQVESIDKKKFIKIMSDKNVKAFIVYIALLIFKILIFLA